VRRAVGVGVPALAGLAAEVPGRDLLRLERARPPARLAEAQLVERLGDLEADVQPDQVLQLERPHPEAGRADDPVDVLDRRDPLLQQPQRLQRERPVAAVDQEARPVDRVDHPAVHRAARGARQLQRVVGGRDARDDLDELHQRRRVEEVHADHARGVARRARDRRDRDRRRVGRQHRARRDARQLAEDLVLELQALGGGLDDQLRVGEVLVGADRGQPRADLAGVARQPSLLHQLADPGPRALRALLGRALQRVVEQRPRAALRRELGDARSHRAGADHADDLRCVHARHAIRA
jgi:hypothetical protein